MNLRELKIKIIDDGCIIFTSTSSIHDVARFVEVSVEKLDSECSEVILHEDIEEIVSLIIFKIID